MGRLNGRCGLRFEMARGRDEALSDFHSPPHRFLIRGQLLLDQ